jgi:hypothetical protein
MVKEADKGVKSDNGKKQRQTAQAAVCKVREKKTICTSSPMTFTHEKIQDHKM